MGKLVVGGVGGDGWGRGWVGALVPSDRGRQHLMRGKGREGMRALAAS